MADEDEPRQLTSAPALKKLAEMVSFQFKKRKRVFSATGEDRGAGYVPRKRRAGAAAPTAVTKATVTPLVEAIFEGFFKDQLEDTGNKDGDEWNRRRCGTCNNCLKPDCGKCKGCKKMAKFTGTLQIGKAVRMIIIDRSCRLYATGIYSPNKIRCA